MLYRYKLNKELIGKFKEYYSNLVPVDLIKNMVMMNEKFENYLLKNHREYCGVNKYCDTLFFFNPKYHDIQDVESIINNRRGPIYYVAWFVGEELIRNNKIGKFFLDKEDNMLNKKEISSMIDLEKSDIEYLENLKNVSYKLFWNKFKIPASDLELFFHFPIRDKTAGLHLHIRYNTPRKFSEEMKSYNLDDVINCLKKGISMEDMVLSRQRERGGYLYISKSSRVYDEILKDNLKLSNKRNYTL